MRRERTQVFVNQSNLAIRKVSDIDDVDLTNNEDGAFLVYDATSQKFVATKTLNGVTIEDAVIRGGTF